MALCPSGVDPQRNETVHSSASWSSQHHHAAPLSPQEGMSAVSPVFFFADVSPASLLLHHEPRPILSCDQPLGTDFWEDSTISLFHQSFRGVCFLFEATSPDPSADVAASEFASQSASWHRRRKHRGAAPSLFQESLAAAFAAPQEASPSCELKATVFSSDDSPAQASLYRSASAGFNSWRA